MYPGNCCCQRHTKTSKPGAEPIDYIAHNQSSESPWSLARIQAKLFFRHVAKRLQKNIGFNS